MNEELNPYILWRSEELLDRDGVITGANDSYESLLPCWWKCYQQHNDYPVTFIDFGLSSSGHQWCSERGEVIKFSVPFHLFKKREFVHAQLGYRILKIWFKKPFALLQSPYRRSLWLDVDCEVKGDISKLFPLAENPSGMALAHSSPEKIERRIQRGYLKEGEQGFNSGVIAYLWTLHIFLGYLLRVASSS